VSVKIRLTRQGKKKRPYYRIIVADSRAPRDGKFIDILGVYQPMEKENQIQIDKDKASDWLKKGALPSDTVKDILKKEQVIK